MATSEFLDEVNRTIDVYEEVICSCAEHIREVIERYGEVKALERLVQTVDLQRCFKQLREHGALEDTFEAVITRYPDLFQDSVVKAAKWRLEYAHV
jgi:predicted RNA-binding Zn ribbon-like protein